MRITAIAIFITGLQASVLDLGPSPVLRPTSTITASLLGLTTRLRGGEQKTSGLPIADASVVPQNLDGNVNLKLNLNYGVDRGTIVAVGPSSCFGSGDINKAPKLTRKEGERWEGFVTVPRSEGVVKYQYVIIGDTHRYEARIAERSVNVLGLPEGAVVDVQDSFRSPKPATLATSCFSRAVFGKGKSDLADQEGDNPGIAHAQLTWAPAPAGDLTLRFTVFAPRMENGHSVWVSGASSSLGSWSASSRLRMAHIGRGLYVAQATVSKSELPMEYKYEVVDKSGDVACSESGKRKVTLDHAGAATFIIKDEAFNYPNSVFKGAGVAIPVSAIKTRDSTGIGEFLDLKKMADWCTKTGLQLIQILPINDSGEDPSPYSAASSFALHPIFVRPLAVCDYYTDLCGADMSGTSGWATSLVEKLNGNWKIDYPRILQEKAKLMDGIFDAVGRDKVLADEGMMAWVEKNKKWLLPYAGFKVQMGKERSFNNKWFDCTTWSKRASEVESIVNSGSPDYDQVARVYFVQYHLHLQLLEASKYCESLGIAVKGDLPIGVTRCSQDVWAEPNIFKLDKNAGAPGDPEQNWGFPPYNWNEMHKDGCNWWRRRLQHMEQYFHAYRIDHILGFFRMWEIPKHGSGGRYEPSSGLRENGLKNLRAIQTASNMLICGEDLGNVPAEVGPVLLELGILGLKIQRWCDGKTGEYPLLTVAASSCHDTSPCRLWWNENWGEAEHFFHSFCGDGHTPGGPPDWVSQKIIKMHAESSAMWTINPIQDYIDMFEDMRSQNAKADMINVPGSTEGCWVYRCHKRMEDLVTQDKFNAFVKKMLQTGKRGATY